MLLKYQQETGTFNKILNQIFRLRKWWMRQIVLFNK